MKREQILPSGIIVRQDFSEAVRPVLFQTEYEEFRYATEGGTIFVVRFRGRPYGLTCGHVFKGFEPGALFIADEKVAKKGSLPAPINGLAYPSALRNAAVETDIADICVIRFADDIPSGFFRGSEYVLDEQTFVTSKPGHSLRVSGVLKEKTWIMPPDITIGYSQLQFRDDGPASFDQTLRQGIALYEKPEFSSIVGISGSPVYDETANALCGLVARGTMTGNRAIIYFIDIFDVMRLLEAVNDGTASASYTKVVSSPKGSGQNLQARQS